MVPQRLKEGDKVALIAPSRFVSPAEVESALNVLRQWHLCPVVDEHIFWQSHQMAGTDGERAEAVQEALNSEEIKALWFVRGGYGAVRMVDLVDFSILEKYPKWLIGYSDITVLHSHVSASCAVATLHATMPINVVDVYDWRDYEALTSLHDALFCGVESLSGAMDCPSANGYYRKGVCNGRLMGGNLSVLISLIGSKSDIDTKGKILFIEDVDEYLYHIDRMMRCLKRAGRLDNLAGLIVGAFSSMHDNTVPFGITAEEIVWDAVREYDYPVTFQSNMGHVGLQNKALPLNIEATLEVSSAGASLLFHP